FPSWVTLVLFAAFWVFLSFFLVEVFDRAVRRLTARTQTRTAADDLWIRPLHAPLLIFLFLLGGWVTLSLFELTPRLTRLAEMGISLTTALVLIVAGVKLYRSLLAEYGQRYDSIKPSLPMLQLLGNALIILIGVLITLNSLNISISPLLTTLGIGGLAVALAVKDTLANFFAGLYILADRPIRVGDYIKMDPGPEGYVEGVGWRSTRLRNLSEKTVIIPNAKVAESIITNYFLPDRRSSVSIIVSVAHGTDTRRLEKILLDEASRAAGEVEGMLPSPAPLVRFIPGFKESSLDFTLICFVREFVDQYFVQHELRHRILERFRKEDIEIPIPERRVRMDRETV
ncbi:MAG TPA: mechanosensitive ion channel family protein, partial [Thermodesulfobacteriota bacterium]|nr:mechanosensitive ion channel family protein [Thermodesulfobacteriota bacterium]